MIKFDLAKVVQEQTSLSLKEASDAVELILNTMKETLSEGETIKLSGFGTFLVRKRADRKGRNLKTGEEIPVHARWVVTFKPSDQFKEMVDDERAVQ